MTLTIGVWAFVIWAVVWALLFELKKIALSAGSTKSPLCESVLELSK